MTSLTKDDILYPMDKTNDMINESTTQTNPQSLHVPQSAGGRMTMEGVKSIMDAYNSQSKVELFDDNTALSSDDVSGVKAKNIPMSALRPKTPIGEDDQGRPIYSKNQYAEDMAKRADIRKAYMKMTGGIKESENENEEDNVDNGDNGEYAGIPEAEIDYIEDVPEDNEGILHYLETCINNAEANLEMLKSLYAALRN